MDDTYFKQLRKMSYEDEMRYRLLIRGVKQILVEKKEEGLLKKLFRRKKHIEAKAWK
ncbi:hypothetical protein [Paenibacillus rigui]|uniref:hypothetical protein n=1 Tax=Paenibacillus rigui TaxID=554312 RepID=UPI0015C5AFF8|nr:hypothetical protein [Paenibacillus rigui]